MRVWRIYVIINPRHACAARVILSLAFRPSVCLLSSFLAMKLERIEETVLLRTTCMYSATISMCYNTHRRESGAPSALQYSKEEAEEPSS